MNPLPLIISGSNDPHVDAVATSLRNKGVEAIHTNKAYLANLLVTSSLTKDFIGSIELDKVTAIWYRRSWPVSLPEDMPEKWKNWCEQEYTQAFLGLLYNLNAYWVSDPFCIKRASIKTNQLKIASKITKFNIPEYIITSDRQEVAKFTDMYAKSVVIKPLGRPIVTEGKQYSTIFTNTTDSLCDSDWANLHLCPSIFQKLVTKKAELRVTVVGQKIFPALIDLSNLGNHIDYRKVDPYTLKHKEIDIPPNMAEGCLKLMSYYNIKFAAFDFILGEDNEFYFLEINPNGQWLWIEEMTGMKIADAIADELCNR